LSTLYFVFLIFAANYSFCWACKIQFGQDQAYVSLGDICHFVITLTDFFNSTTSYAGDTEPQLEGEPSGEPQTAMPSLMLRRGSAGAAPSKLNAVIMLWNQKPSTRHLAPNRCKTYD
jgi:hypothetical protein